ncbi:DUF493 domain-containing protein [Sphingobacterium sp. HJSM2_6]|uniref:DUF493 domain-containing protein n=1 Tax=Sphingobacterium sp. HJSM2_6 TaxID=3366264 RepID=UPI003BDAB7FC
MSDFNNSINVKDFESTGNQDFYKTFRDKLIDVEQFPSIYSFKFIVKTDSNKMEEVKAIFKHPSAKFAEKSSSGGKYTSITIQNYVVNADEVIEYYKKVAEIPEVMML